MEIKFTKYHGTGNDFVIIDDRLNQFDEHNKMLIANMCSRRFGIGADGLILLRISPEYDFQMVYFNSDGNESSMCGNGGRCIVHFANSLAIFDKKTNFIAIDGPHEAKMLEDGSVKLKMGDVHQIQCDGDALVMDTGSPHYVLKVDSVKEINIQEQGAKIRYSDTYGKQGINVNFVETINNGIEVATYERGVEDETYSCGTGVTASALAAHYAEPEHVSSPISISTKGGSLRVYFTQKDEGYSDIWLEGPATVVFKGAWKV